MPHPQQLLYDLAVVPNLQKNSISEIRKRSIRVIRELPQSGRASACVLRGVAGYGRHATQVSGARSPAQVGAGGGAGGGGAGARDGEVGAPRLAEGGVGDTRGAGVVRAPAERAAEHAPGMCSLPSRDWLPLRVHARFPCAIGSCCGYMLASLVRLAPAAGICSRPLCDWLPLWVCARVPCAIGSRCGYVLASLVRLASTHHTEHALRQETEAAKERAEANVQQSLQDAWTDQNCLDPQVRPEAYQKKQEITNKY
eukprot:1185403-Prorocentrum_minimum.AAC.3